MNVWAADVGGGSIRAALVSSSGQILARHTAPTPQDPVEGVALVRRMWDGFGPAAGAALAIAGGVRASDGEITQSPNLARWEGTRPGRQLGCPICNDANAAALGELWRGSLRSVRHAVMVTLGTGVGGALLLDGRLFTGANGCAGEIGHLPVGDGVLEDLASASAVARAAGVAHAAEAASRARAGDAQARAAFDHAGRALGIALAGVVNLLNPQTLCLGGGMGAAFDLLLPSLEREINQRAFRLAREPLSIVPATLGGDAGIYGAAYFALENHL